MTIGEIAIAEERCFDEVYMDFGRKWPGVGGGEIEIATMLMITKEVLLCACTYYNDNVEREIRAGISDIG